MLPVWRDLYASLGGEKTGPGVKFKIHDMTVRGSSAQNRVSLRAEERKVLRTEAAVEVINSDLQQHTQLAHWAFPLPRLAVQPPMSHHASASTSLTFSFPILLESLAHSLYSIASFALRLFRFECEVATLKIADGADITSLFRVS